MASKTCKEKAEPFKNPVPGPSQENVNGSQSEKSKASEEVPSSEEDGSIAQGVSHLDVFSPDFDPMAAIYSSDLAIPAPSAQILDNVESFVVKVLNPPKKNTGKSKSKLVLQEGEKLERQFLPEQMPIQTKRKVLPNLLRYMEKQSDEARGGPMSILGRCLTSGARIRVHIRGINRIRGYAVGTLVAFDKHWNLALVDVDETFTRKRFPKMSLFDVDKVCQKFDNLKVKNDDTVLARSRSRASKKPAPTNLKREQAGCSTIQIVKTRRKTELCQRYVPQVVLRGEHVALVQIIS